MRINNLVKMFLREHVQSLVPMTQTTYRHFLERLDLDCGNVDVANFRPQNFLNWLDCNPQWQRSTRKLVGQVVSSMFSWAFRNDMIDRHPLYRKVRLPGMKVRGWDSIPTKEEYNAIRSVSPEWFRDFLDILYFTGRRPRDVCEVRATDLDLDRGIWKMAKHKTADKVGGIEIVLCKEAIDIFTRLSQQHPCGALLRRADGQPITKDTYSCFWQGLREKLGLRKTIVCYGFRHLLATDLINKNVPLTEVASLMGHKGIQTCVTTYVHLCTDKAKLREALAKR